MRQINQKINKFTILGAGTAGCLTASFIKKHTNAEVEWIFDSNTPAQSVGEGSTIPLATSLFKELGFNYTLLDIMGGSLKFPSRTNKVMVIFLIQIIVVMKRRWKKFVKWILLKNLIGELFLLDQVI